MDVHAFTSTIGSVSGSSFKDKVGRRQALDAARALCRRLESPMEHIVRTCWVEVRQIH